ncbi:hypothetical protein [Corynebacterium cystitidis]|uniref:hypothetical protein n=1 Tax=Corynebacterium cystitidis TaxID=35757 RepID=UPI00211F4165|nr:hypothetical protein [Corynebacterium cystitidis]
METLETEFNRHAILADALARDPADATLSGSERALVTIAQYLIADFDALDGIQQRTLVSALVAQAQRTEQTENYARQLFTAAQQ